MLELTLPSPRVPLCPPLAVAVATYTTVVVVVVVIVEVGAVTGVVAVVVAVPLSSRGVVMVAGVVVHAPWRTPRSPLPSCPPQA